jgi:hypothetical protein
VGNIKLYEQLDHFHTFWQFLKRFPTNIRPKNLLPDETITSIGNLSIDTLVERGIKGILWDIDGTMMGYRW